MQKNQKIKSNRILLPAPAFNSYRHTTPSSASLKSSRHRWPGLLLWPTLYHTGEKYSYSTCWLRICMVNILSLVVICLTRRVFFCLYAKEPKYQVKKNACPLFQIVYNSIEVKCFSNIKASPFTELLNRFEIHPAFGLLLLDWPTRDVHCLNYCSRLL